jgi:hypothetical protein
MPRLAVRLVGLALLWAALSLAWGCAAFTDPIPPGQPMPLHAPQTLVARLTSADTWLAGRVTKIEPSWEYDDPCGLVAKLLMRCSGTLSYRVKVDGPKHGTMELFVPHDEYRPMIVGDSGVFLLHTVPAYRWGDCHRYQGAAGSYCAFDWRDALVDTLDILPLVWAETVDSLWKGRR